MAIKKAQKQTIVPIKEESLPAQVAAPLHDLAPVNQQRNAFEVYGDQVAPKNIVGTLLKFNKGDWLTGDDDEVADGTKLVANMDQLMAGWIKWVDNRPEQQIMGPVAEGFMPPLRSTLGDSDKEQWEVDSQGKERDPWQFSNYLVLKEVGKAGTEENLYTFATSSKSGLGAVGELCKKYGRAIREDHAEDFPVVQLDQSSYNHQEYGRIKTPVLSIIGWEPKAEFTADHTAAKTAKSGRK